MDDPRDGRNDHPTSCVSHETDRTNGHLNVREGEIESRR